jgi:hypothetical protein
VAVRFFTGLGQLLGSIRTTDPVSVKAGDLNLRFDPARHGDLSLKVEKGFLTSIALEKTDLEGTEISSQESAPGPFETFFSSFRLEAIPFYNFWIPEEDADEGAPLGDRDLDEVPRFIKVVWDRAPDLPGEPLQRVKGLRTDREKSLWVGRGPGRPTYSGLSFDMGHLDPEKFSKVTRMLANSHVAPGVLTTVVDVPGEGSRPDEGISSARIGPIHHIDEDVFLEHPDMRGVSVQEAIANFLSRRRTRAIVGGDILQVGDRIELRGVSSGSPVLSISARVPTAGAPDPIDSPVDVVDKISSVPSDPSTGIPRSRVNFIDPGIIGALRGDRIAAAVSPEHLESTLTLASALPDLIAARGVRSDSIDLPSFPSPSGLEPIEYVGYVLEKYRLDSTGVFRFVKEFEIPDRNVGEFYDSEIKYGDVYRYRVRSIVRWTYPSEDDLSAKRAAPFKSTYFGSEWSGWAYGMVVDTIPPNHPDELTVIPDSIKRRVLVTVKFPHDPQRDIGTMRLFRKVRDARGFDLTDWDQVGPDHGPENFLYIDEDVSFYQETGLQYVYAAQSFSRHGEESTLSEQLGVRLNRDRDIRGEFSVELVSCAGVQREDFGAFSVRPAKRTSLEIVIPFVQGPGRDPVATFTLGARAASSRSALDPAVYIVRAESLDTGEVRDSRIDLRAPFIPDRIQSVPRSAFGGTATLGSGIRSIAERVQLPILGRNPIPRI